MDVFETDALVIGAGAVGLASGRALANAGLNVLVVEAARAIATETSSRNSEVVHAGLYYPTGSNKARFCVEGRRKLYAYCEQRGVAFNRCGKLVVARPDETGQLAAINDRATANGVEGLSLIDGAQARSLEPELSGDIAAAIVSEVSGIFDSHGYFLALQGEIEDAGGAIAFDAPVDAIRRLDEGLEVEIGGASPARVRAGVVINAAGHRALELARRLDGGPHYDSLDMHWAKGNYFTVSGRGAFSRLIYPMPTTASLGLHLTIDMGGGVRLGPDVEWLPDDAGPPFDYQVDPGRAEQFLASVQRFWPGLAQRELSPGYSGVRPKIVKKGEPTGDFLIDGPDSHGIVGLVNLIGIESPGLTSSIALGEHVAELVGT